MCHSIYLHVPQANITLYATTCTVWWWWFYYSVMHMCMCVVYLVAVNFTILDNLGDVASRPLQKLLLKLAAGHGWMHCQQVILTYTYTSNSIPH